MSKISKLITNPKAFVVDAVKNRVSPSRAQKSKPISKAPAKPAAKPIAKTTAKPAINPATQKEIKTTGQLELLKLMVMQGEYGLISRAWNIMESDDTTATKELARFVNVQIEAELAQAKHEEVMVIGRKMINKYNNPIGHYYRAHSLFVRGHYDDALMELQNLLRTRPKHADGVYLLCEICERIDNHELAWKSLETLALTSKRNKTWHVMANLVQESSDLFRLLTNWRIWKENGVGPAFHQDVSEFIALGALRAGNFEMARAIWRETVFSASKKKGGFTVLKNRKPSFSSNRAEAALGDLNTMFKKAKIEMFLVSGTLLGCVRENQLLGHDKDIDIGIWSKVPESKVLELATTSGMFYVLKSRSPEILRLKHVNGIAIDVFYHFKDRSDYWHGGVKMIWHNTPFKLTKRAFLGAEYSIPENYDLYLTENFGDWKTPVIKFDSAFDTPNGEVKSIEEMAIHSFKGLLASAIDDNWERVVFYLNKLREFGETDFADRFEAECVTSDVAIAAFADEKAEVDGQPSIDQTTNNMTGEASR